MRSCAGDKRLLTVAHTRVHGIPRNVSPSVVGVRAWGKGGICWDFCAGGACGASFSLRPWLFCFAFLVFRAPAQMFFYRALSDFPGAQMFF